MGLLLLSSITAFSQSHTGSVETKWKVRVRVIDAIPPSSSYNLSGSNVVLSSAVVPELDFTYYFTKNLAAELILGTTRHTVKLDGAGAKTDLGKVWLLPPTLNLQYHLPLKNIEPYIGAGINYSFFYGVKDEGAKLAYTNSAAFSTQAGVDIALKGKWFVNVDVKRLFLQTDVTVNGDAANKLKGVKVDPWVLGVGVGVKL